MQGLRRRKESVNGKRFLTFGELQRWTKEDESAESRDFWEPAHNLEENDLAITLNVDLPGSGTGDVQIALLPRSIIVKLTVRLLACRSWKDLLRVLFGPGELFRRFELPALIDVNRVTAELDMGVLTVIAPKQAVGEQPAEGVPDRSHVFAV